VELEDKVAERIQILGVASIAIAHELQVWILREHLVEIPLIHRKQAAT